MKIAVIGSGCSTCKKLHEVVEKVVKDEGIEAEVEYSTDITRIVELGIMHSPVILVDGKSVGFKSLSENDVKAAILGNSEGGGDTSNCTCGGNC